MKKRKNNFICFSLAIISIILIIVGFKFYRFPTYEFWDIRRAKCDINTETGIRVYDTSGEGDDIGSVVTYKSKDMSESEIFYSIGAPFIDSVTCNKDTVTLHVFDWKNVKDVPTCKDFTLENESIVLTLDKIKNELVSSPNGFKWCQPKNLSQANRIFDNNLNKIIGSGLVGLGLIMDLILFLKLKNN